MSAPKANGAGGKEAGKPQGQKGQWQPRNPGASKKNDMLTNETKVHDWLEASCKRLAVDDRSNWTCLFGTERKIPKLKSVRRRTAEMLDQFDDNDDDNEGKAAIDEDETDPNDRALVESLLDGSTEISTIKEKAGLKRILRAAIEKLKKPHDQDNELYADARKRALAEWCKANENLELAKGAIFIDLWNNIHDSIRERMMLRADWDTIWENRDVIGLLNTVDACHGKLIDTSEDKEVARMLAYEAIINLKMRQGQSVSDFKKDVKAAFEHQARCKREGEPEAPESEKMVIFMRGLNSTHSRFKHHYEDLPKAERPTTLDQLAAMMVRYEASHERIYKSDYKGARAQGQLAIHSVTKKDE